jgi:hypothetical protein
MYLGGSPFPNLTRRQIDSIEQAFAQAPAPYHDGLWRVLRGLVGDAESYAHTAVRDAAYTALWRSGEFRFPPGLGFMDDPRLAGAGGLTVDVVKAA